MLFRLAHLLRKSVYFFVRPITLGVRVMLVKDGQVLLVRHTYIDGWYFPGGGLKRGETLEAAARREVREEAGVEAGKLEWVGAYSHLIQTQTDHNVLFLCTDFTLTGRHDAEIAEVRFFSLDHLPADLDPGHRQRADEFRAGQPSPKFGEW